MSPYFWAGAEFCSVVARLSSQREGGHRRQGATSSVVSQQNCSTEYHGFKGDFMGPLFTWDVTDNKQLQYTDVDGCLYTAHDI